MGILLRSCQVRALPACLKTICAASDRGFGLRGGYAGNDGLGYELEGFIRGVSFGRRAAC